MDTNSLKKRLLLSEDKDDESLFDDDYQEPEKKKMRTAPTGQQSEGLTTVASGLLFGGIAGTFWVFSDRFELQSPWIALLLGAAVALGVRFGSKGHDYSYQTGITLTLYTIALFSTVAVMTYLKLNKLYPGGVTFQIFESEMINTVTQNLTNAAAYIGGAIVSVIAIWSKEPGRAT